jgi:hypothetical protein
MTFAFFGIFADRSPGLAEQLNNAWPDANVLLIDTPFQGIAARLPARLYQVELENIPEDAISMTRAISAMNPKARFVLLRANCWGGECFYWGQIVRGGDTIESVDGDQALRQLIMTFGADIGESEIFAPLTRSYPWVA